MLYISRHDRNVLSRYPKILIVPPDLFKQHDKSAHNIFPGLHNILSSLQLSYWNVSRLQWASTRQASCRHLPSIWTTKPHPIFHNTPGPSSGYPTEGYSLTSRFCWTLDRAAITAYARYQQALKHLAVPNILYPLKTLHHQNTFLDHPKNSWCGSLCMQRILRRATVNWVTVIRDWK